MTMRNILQNGFAATLALGLAMAPVAADAAIDFSAASGTLAAKVTFDVVGGTNLQVTLTNTSLTDVLVPIDVLTAVFFNGVGALGSSSAVLNTLSTVIYDTPPVGGVVGGEWGFASGLAGPNGTNAGISSSGLGGIFGQPTFPGDNLEGQTALDGLQYGIVSAGDNSATGNGGITGSGGLIKNSVVFTLSGLAPGFSLGNITNVWFQYGTAMSEPGFGGGSPTCPGGVGTPPFCNQQVETPEPMSMALLGVGLLGLGAVRRRRAIAA